MKNRRLDRGDRSQEQTSLRSAPCQYDKSDLVVDFLCGVHANMFRIQGPFSAMKS